MIRSVITFRAVCSMSVVAFVLAVIVGCVPTISDKYHATVLDDSGQESLSEVSIEVAPGVDFFVRGECFPHSDNGCRVVIFWFYEEGTSFEFAKGQFVARDIKNHDIEHSSAHPLEAHPAGRGKRIGVETGEVVVLWLHEKNPPKEFELVMPKLKINGVEKEVPIIYFKHSRGPALTPIIVNY